MNYVYVYKVISTFRDLKWKGFYIEDTATGWGNRSADISLVVHNLIDKRDRINYRGDRTELQTFMDGYWGRPLMPADSYRLRRLNKREISELEKELDKAEALALSPSTF